MRSFSSPVNLHFAVIINIISSASLQTGTRLRRKKTAASLLTVLVRAIKKNIEPTFSRFTVIIIYTCASSDFRTGTEQSF